MKFFIDFEATQPDGEIIAIGMVTETGADYSYYIKPEFSKITPMITKLTGITENFIEQKGVGLDWAFAALNQAVKYHCPNRKEQEFYCYGNCDVDFIKKSFKNLQSNEAIDFACFLMTTMKDYSDEVANYFNGITSLINAYNYFNPEVTQKHDPTEDAKMLRKVFAAVDKQPPLIKSPFIKKEVIKENFIMPHGKFFCKNIQMNKEKQFPSCEHAIEWLIRNNINPSKRNEVHRDRIAKNIMKAIRRHKPYMGYSWRREK